MNKAKYALLYGFLTIVSIAIVISTKNFYLQYKYAKESKISSCQFHSIVRDIQDNFHKLVDGSSLDSWQSAVDLSHLRQICGQGVVVSSLGFIDVKGIEIVTMKRNSNEILIKRIKKPSKRFYSITINEASLALNSEGKAKVRFAY